MTHIPHSTHDDEARFLAILASLVSSGALPKLSLWEASLKDGKAQELRAKKAKKEAVEAEKSAKELGVWDEFYGSGKEGKRRGKGKQQEDEEGDGDIDSLRALIQSRQKKSGGFLDGLAAKYTAMESSGSSKPKGKGKRKTKAAETEEDPPKKKARTRKEKTPEIDEEEFSKLQQKLFGGKVKAPAESAVPSTSKTKKARKSN
jgi:DnaJ family protein C protein 9